MDILAVFLGVESQVFGVRFHAQKANTPPALAEKSKCFANQCERPEWLKPDPPLRLKPAPPPWKEGELWNPEGAMRVAGGAKYCG